jgi:zinc D-Ala-D-Ala carboxypeptidase
MIRLSAHFTLDELTVSQEASRRGIDNTPPPQALAALHITAQGLEAVRVRLGCAPIIVSSGYRSLEVNRVIGGSKTSQHITGQAADFIAPAFGNPTEVASALRDSGVEYDQLILEFTRWVHISFASKPRHMALIIDTNGTRPMWA